MDTHETNSRGKRTRTYPARPHTRARRIAGSRATAASGPRSVGRLGTTPRDIGTAVALLIAGVAFLAPSLWAWRTTGSFNEAAAFTMHNDALASLRGAGPRLIEGSFIGIGIGLSLVAVVSLLTLRGIERIELASQVRLRLTILCAVVAGLVLFASAPYAPWPSSLMAAGVAIALLALVPIATMRHGPESPRLAMIPWWIWRLVAALLLGSMGLIHVGYGLQPVPMAEIKLPGAKAEVVLLIERSASGTVFLRPDAGSGSVARNSFSLVVVPDPAESVRYCKNSPVSLPLTCD